MRLRAPLTFRPVYQRLVWGGRRLERWRSNLPEGPIGESWDLADHERGMSVVADGPLAGQTLNELTRRHGAALVGAGFAGGPFPILVKLIDAADRLSVQVHPDDAIARALGLGPNGKTECWFVLEDGGVLYQGTRPGIDRAAFERALAAGTVEASLNRFDVRAGDFFFVAARTVHALGAGCLLYEVQQTSDVTFRVHDWGRVGLDGKPRPLHLQQSLSTIDFTAAGFGPTRPLWAPHSRGGRIRCLTDSPSFAVDERALDAADETTAGNAAPTCAIVSCLEGELGLSTDDGLVALLPTQTALVPATAGGWVARARGAPARFLVSVPRFSA